MKDRIIVWFKNRNWDLSADNLAQIGHALGGALFVVWPFALWGKTGAILGTIAVYLYLIPKEFWFDLKYEKGQSVGIGFKDMAFWTLGMLLAWGSLWWKGAV